MAALSALVLAVTPKSLSAATYSWAKVEVIAMESLRCRWNSFWYTNGPCEILVVDLRPGALCSPETREQKVRVEGEMVSLQQIGQPLQGNLNDKCRIGSVWDVDTATTAREDHAASLLTDNDTGNDGLALMGDTAWFVKAKARSGEENKPQTTPKNKPKSRASKTKRAAAHAKAQEANAVGAEDADVVSGKTSSSTIMHSQLSTIVDNQKAAAELLDTGDACTGRVWDVFTNRQRGLRLSVSEPGVLLTTAANFAAAVGPMFLRLRTAS